MASFPPSQQNASQHQGNTGNNLAYAAAPALSTNPPLSQSIDPYRCSLSNEAVGSHPNNNIFIALNPWNSPFVYVPNQPNNSYTQQTTVQQSYPTGYSYRQSAPVQQANLPNYHPQFQPFHNLVLANRQQASLRTTAAPQQPEQQTIQARRLVPRIALPPDRMSNGNNPTYPGDRWFSLAGSEQQPTSFAMERQPARPARNIDHYSSEEVSPRSKPNRAPRVEDYPDLMKDAQAHLARLGQSVPQIQGINPPTTRSSSNSSIPILSLAGPEELVAAVANASTAETTQQLVDLTRRQPSNTTSQQQQEPETFAQLWDNLDHSEFHAHNPPVISGDQKELPVDFPDYLKTNHRAAQTVAGVLSQSSKTLDIPLRSKAVRDALNRALAVPSMVVVSEVLTSVGAINAAPANQHSSAPPTGVCPRSFFGMDGPLTSLVAPGRSATVRPVRSANAYPCEGGYTPHDSLPSPPGAGVSQRVPTPGLPSPPERSAAGRPSLQPASTTAAMSPPHPPTAVNPGNSPQQARPAYIQRYPDILGPGMRPNVAPWEAPLDQSYPEGSYSVRTGSSQSYTTAFTTAKDPVALMKIARDTRDKREGKRKYVKVPRLLSIFSTFLCFDIQTPSYVSSDTRREEDLGSVTPPESPRMVGEVGFPSVVAALYGNEGESSKRPRTDSGLEPFPSLMGTHQANESRPRGHLFPGYAGNRHPIPPTTAYTNIQQTQGSRPPLHRTHESSPPYMLNQQAQETIPPYMINQQPQESSPPYMNNQETQTAAPAHMINQQTQAACPDPQPTRVDAEMLAAIGPYASLF
ncbi:unnamed protein product [Clonostachys byssicola]|uniref:Uncharacterized protein n=1 Tax=Clonostachys byssicola TaxID=160290 RepID=A0A9N9Y2Z4_9HYPO|nr:unnamed protein product [Clonostachys byssicola]